MAEFGDQAASVVYFCAGAAADDVYELYHKCSPPDAPPKPPAEESGVLDRVYHNARILLDENQGGFSEGEAESSARSRAEAWTMY